MTQHAKITINWTGFQGGPGYTNLAFDDFTEGDVTQAIVDGAIGKTDAWLDAWVGLFPAGLSYVISPSVEIVNTQTGALEGYMTGTPDLTRVGTSVGHYAGGSGACINWYTTAIRNGRRIRGRTFMVPLGNYALGDNGTIDDPRLVGMIDATTLFMNDTRAGELGVWARPTAPGAADGRWAPVESFRINDKVAQLRSRRD
jgi:hypothetical protein